MSSKRTPDSGTPTISRGKALAGALLALVLAGGAFSLIANIAEFGKVGSVLRHARAEWLPVCVAGQLLAYAGYVLAYRDAARASGGPEFGWWTTVRVVVFGAGAAVLGASVGGLAVDFWALRQTGTRPHTAARRVLAVGTIEWVVLSVYACGAAIATLITRTNAPVGMAAGWLIAVPACVAGALWFTSPRRVRHYTEPKHSRGRDGGRLRRASEWIRDKLLDARADAIAGVLLVRHLLSHPLRYWGAALGYPIFWAGDILVLYAAVRAFGVNPGVAPLVLAYASGFVISALPLPAGGAGGIEASIAFTLNAVGIPLAAALLAVFVYRLMTFWFPVVPALLLLPSIRRLHQQLHAVPHTRSDRDERISFRPSADPAG